MSFESPHTTQPSPHAPQNQSQSQPFHPRHPQTQPLPGHPQQPNPQGFPQQGTVLSGRALVKYYGEVVGLAGVDVSVQAGEALAVMGPSGNGKTTLLHVLAGILTPDQGEVWLGGERVDQLGDAARTVLRRRRLGFVFQDNQLLAEVPADENVALPLMVDGVSRREAVGRARNMLAQVGLSAEVSRRPGELSGGQAQRVAIARALVGEPQAVFADETGIISDAGLSSPDELIVIRGVAKNSPGVAPSDHPRYLDTWRGNAMDSRMAMLLALVAFGIALVLFPLLSLVGQAAGVAAKRREHRLAALRLAGATRSQVLWLSAVEQAVLGFLGAIAGLIGYIVLSPLIARIPLGGGRWYLHDLTPSWWVALIVRVAVPVLSVISALIGLGRVSITPLGVVRGQTRKSTSALRLGLLVIGPIMLAVLGTGGAVLPLVIGIGMAALAVRVVGPWAVQVVGKFLARTAKGPVVLLAGRRLADDPKGAFRPVAALVLSGFVTGFLALFMPYGLSQDGKDVSFQLFTNQGQTAVVAEDARKRLSEAGFKGEVTTGDQTVNISVSTTERERLRTVLYDVVPSQVPLTDAERDKQDAGVFQDMRLGVALLLGLVFVTGAASTAAGAVGTALDQAAPAKALRRSGVPLQVIERSARLAAVVPVVAVGLPVVGFGALCGLALSGGQVITQGSSGVILLLGQVVVGLVLVAVAGAAGAPVLRKASVG